MANKQNFDKESLSNLVVNINADVIICAGWMDKDYVDIVKKYSNIIPTILTMDNHWDGSLKQHVLKLISPFYLKKIFSHIWVPGSPQKAYARKLNFSEEQILTGFYVANINIFEKVNYQKENSFIYIGRYIEHKGVKDLWTAFIELKDEFPNNWKLKCIGTGDLWDERVLHEDIEHFGFLQPNEILSIISGGVFVLPSHFEPWGVVVHEFATAGFPMIISNKVGSGTSFLDENGFTFKSENIDDLKTQMKKMMILEAEEMEIMSDISKVVSRRISNEIWSKQLSDVIKNYKN